ncbi:hypothetical protein F511_02024 [Dorcoceras hygrometricum]|uniref:Uncharacterized protein n=1 Tax=Dorcoceras hygrometricum TaxID=472368 RepID=A0A2Z7AQ07_9LAMI|nr:hypothetical protein F511_02024 [Dorcoceras hygrometricum]
MQRRRDQQPLRTTILPAPATTAGALPAGPYPGPAGPNLTDHGPNRACMKENDPLKAGARRCQEHAARGVLLLAHDSSDNTHQRTTPSLT